MISNYVIADCMELPSAAWIYQRTCCYLGIRRDGQTLIPHGYTRLQLGDRVTFMGTKTSLAEAMLRFDA